MKEKKLKEYFEPHTNVVFDYDYEMDFSSLYLEK